MRKTKTHKESPRRAPVLRLVLRRTGRARPARRRGARALTLGSLVLLWGPPAFAQTRGSVLDDLPSDGLSGGRAPEPAAGPPVTAVAPGPGSAPTPGTNLLPSAEVLFVDLDRRGQATGSALTTLTLPPWRRRAFIGTLAGAGGVGTLGGVLGALALAQAAAFRSQRDTGADADRLFNTSQQTRALAFSADLLFGAGALLGLSALVLRFGSGGQTPTPAPGESERDGALPGHDEAP